MQLRARDAFVKAVTTGVIEAPASVGAITPKQHRYALRSLINE